MKTRFRIIYWVFVFLAAFLVNTQIEDINLKKFCIFTLSATLLLLAGRIDAIIDYKFKNE